MLRLELGDDVHLRLLEESDAEELHALIEANRAMLSMWLPWAARQDRAGTLAFIRATRRQLADNDGLQTAIVRRGRIAGVIGVHRIDWPQRCTSLGYWLAREAQGHGVMTRAVRAYVDHAFGLWRLDRVEIRAATENRRSRAIPERLGFSFEGVLRRAELVGGRWVDHAVYAKLAASAPAAASAAAAR